MSRRKQAKPRSFKPEVESRSPVDMVQYEDDADTQATAADAEGGGEVGEVYEGKGSVKPPTPTPFQIDKQETNDSLDSEALGTDSSSRSQTPDDHTSPPSSCTTPNSDAELSFTVGVTDATPYACQFCDKAFPRLSFLKKHEQTHGDCLPFRCEFCSRLFKHKRSRDRHIKLHTGDKKYRCSQCAAAFSRSDHLKIHMKTHDTQKPFQCTVCNRGFNTAAAFTSHMQNHKPKARDDAASTSTAFVKQEQLQNHLLNAHTSSSDESRKSIPLSLADQILPLTTKLACIYCTKDSFTTMEQLQVHVQAEHSSILSGDLRDFSLSRHSSTPPPHLMRSPPPLIPVPSSDLSSAYSCTMCTMRFSTLHRLRKHCLTVHKELTDSVNVGQTPLLCIQCATQFHSAADLTEHYLTVHGGSSPSLPTASPLPELITAADLNRKTPRPNSENRKSKRMCIEESSRLDLTPSTSAGQYEYPFLCNQCEAHFSDFESFRSHLKSHLEQAGSVRSFPQEGSTSSLDAFHQDLKLQNNCVCPYCGTTFTDLVSSEQHICAHFLSTAAYYRCQKCVNTFPKPYDVQKHLMDTHAQQLYQCSLCKEMFDSKMAIEVHFAMKHTTVYKMFRCLACPNSVFNTELEFSLHFRTVHGSHSLIPNLQSQSKNLRCIFCGQVFASDLEMQFHLTTHTEQFRCSFCPETFQIEFLRDRHMQTYHANARTLNAETEDSVDGEKSLKKCSSSPNQKHPSPGRTSQKSSSGENNNVKKQHEASQLNNCDICERNDFTTETELVAHRKLVHHSRNNAKNEVVSLQCAYCNENCKTRTELENHTKSHSQSSGVSGKHKCNICDEICSSAILLTEHKLRHCKVLPGNCCMQCKTSLSTKEQFYSHLAQHNNNNNNSANQKTKSQIALPTPCVICRQTLTSDVEVHIHAQYHYQDTQQCPCSICFKMVDMQNIVVTEGNYMCSSCFTVPNDSQQSFHCSECQFTFETSVALEQHLDSAHKKSYSCNICQASFENEGDVQIHVMTHLSEGKNYECHLCRKLFSSFKKLQVHLIEHTFAGCRGYTCYLCSSVFTAASGLQRHITTHGLAARPYDCSHCSLKFFFRAELENHSRSHVSRKPSTNTDLDPSKYYNNKKIPVQNQNDVQERPTIKKEPADEEDKENEYVDVDFPSTSTEFRNEQSVDVEEGSTVDNEEVQQVDSDSNS